MGGKATVCFMGSTVLKGTLCRPSELPVRCSSWHARPVLTRSILVLLSLIAVPVVAAQHNAVVREQRSFTVEGSMEVWRLIWRDTPRDSKVCGAADPSVALTCPCSGAAYAQVGDLVLERQRSGAPAERMPLTPLFTGSEMLYNDGAVAMLARWPARLRDIDRQPTPAAIHLRPAVPIMRLRDYNHDGIAGEFLLQVDTLPCGKQVAVAVGITRDNPHLHVLTSADHPERPLFLYRWQWDALARNPRPRRVMDWPCGDHGAEDETTMIPRADHGRIHATRITRTCPDTTDANGVWHDNAHFIRKVLSKEVM